VTFIATDNLSGFAPDGRLRLEARRTSSGEGQDVRIQFSTSDRAGNTTSLTAGPFCVDKTPPTISAQASRPPDQNGWYNKDVTVSFVCEDKISGIVYCPPTVTVSQEGRDQVVKGEAIDRAGNRATTSIKISLDKTPPAGTLTINDGAAVTTSTSVTLRIQASDNLSGVAEMRFSNDGKTWSDWKSFQSTCSWDLTTFGGSSSRGAKTVFCQLRDQAGNVSMLSGTIRLGGETVLIGHNESVESVAFSPDGRILASGSWDRTIKLWDVTTGTVLRTLQGHTGGVLSVAFFPDGKILASGAGDGTIKLWDVATGTLLRTLSGHTGSVISVAFSPDGKVLASGSADNTIKLWDVATGREIRTLSAHTLDVASVAFSPDGKILASGSVDTTIKLWDVATGALLRTLRGHTGIVHSVAFSPDGKVLASGSWEEIKLWHMATGSVLRTLQGHTGWVESVAFSPDGKILASGSEDKTIKLWDVATGTLLRTLQGHTGWVESVAFSPDGKILASGSWDGTILLWDVEAVLGKR
jgi:WD40 repeat protein